jgi:hypothetical protein
MKKKQNGLIDRLNKAVDEGRDDEIDMKKVKLFGRELNLTGKVKFHMEPFKKAENRQ